ncbi:hypothetical protein GCM10009639_48580 [Kitasatospora putterlickiae]|uniref:Transposase n=1 Tax=Kitasatospora putterlickiae TaxID=221725 RepID=A0ABN1YBY8_9ACTN
MSAELERRQIGYVLAASRKRPIPTRGRLIYSLSTEPSQARAGRGGTRRPPGDSSASAAVRALSARLARQQEAHGDEVTRLRKAREAAQGENLELRRCLARHETD